MRRVALVAGISVAALILAACDDDRGANKDLPNSKQGLNEEQVEVYLHPDGYPNVVHRCDDTTGIWTTTDRNVWIVYSDPLCGGTAAVYVLDNIPGAGEPAGDSGEG